MFIVLCKCKLLSLAKQQVNEIVIVLHKIESGERELLRVQCLTFEIEIISVALT